eukprot:scaffold114011_cov49-Attheya_sp.AAC.4
MDKSESKRRGGVARLVTFYNEICCHQEDPYVAYRYESDLGVGRDNRRAPTVDKTPVAAVEKRRDIVVIT